MRTIHSLAREHLKKLENKISGMPGDINYPDHFLQLHLNINYFAKDTDYIYYPADENPSLSAKFIDYLKFEALSKGESNTSLSFLTPAHLFFISASEAINLLIRAFCEPGIDKICICNPTFPLYEYCAINHNSPVVDIPLKGDHFEKVDVENILKEAPKLTFVPSPNNPIGCVPRSKDLLTLLSNEKGILTVDEAYIEFADHPSLVSYVNEHSNLVILRSFSKIWGLAGIRSGVIIAHPDLVYTLKKMITPCYFPAHTQLILYNALLNFQNIFSMKERIKKERDDVIRKIKTLEIVEEIFPSEANFLLVKFFNSQLVYQKLLQFGILVRNTSSLIKNTLRISLGNCEENMKLISVLKTL